jgi:hypothetical protein
MFLVNEFNEDREHLLHKHRSTIAFYAVFGGVAAFAYGVTHTEAMTNVALVALIAANRFHLDLWQSAGRNRHPWVDDLAVR